MYLFDFGTSVYVLLGLRYETICCHLYLFDLGTSAYVWLKIQI